MADSDGSIWPVTKIDHLNDDVLREVFNNMDVLDLCVVADVCTTFKKTAQSVFFVRNRSKWFNISIRENHDTACLTKRQMHLRFVPSVMRNFGHKISLLNIKTRYPQDLQTVRKHTEIGIQLINEYCGAALNQLILSGFKLSNELIQILRPQLSRLTRIELRECSLQPDFNGSDMLSFCSELRELNLLSIWSKELEPTLFQIRKNIPTLRSFHLHNCGTKKRALVRFVKANPQLTEIKITNCLKITSRFIRSIVEHVPRLERMNFTKNVFARDFSENARLLMQLTELHSLDISFYKKSISSEITEQALVRVPLRHLGLHEFESDAELIAAIIEMKTIERLRFVAAMNMKVSDILEIVTKMEELKYLCLSELDGLTAADLVAIIQSATKLCELSVVLKYKVEKRTTLDTELYMKILDAVKTRRGALHFVWIFGKPLQERMNVPKKILNANRNLIEIIMPI